MPTICLSLLSKPAYRGISLCCIGDVFVFVTHTSTPLSGFFLLIMLVQRACRQVYSFALSCHIYIRYLTWYTDRYDWEQKLRGNLWNEFPIVDELLDEFSFCCADENSYQLLPQYDIQSRLRPSSLPSPSQCNRDFPCRGLLKPSTAWPTLSNFAFKVLVSPPSFHSLSSHLLNLLLNPALDFDTMHNISSYSRNYRYYSISHFVINNLFWIAFITLYFISK